MAHLNDLSPEILGLFVGFLKSDIPALLNLCVTSRRFTHEAQLHLYSDISVVDTFTLKPLRVDLQRSAKLFTTFIIHNPALAQRVKRLVYRAFTIPERHYMDLLQRSLQLMINITTLHVDFRAIDMVPEDLFEGCTFQLTHFRCGNGLPFKNQLQDLLITQPQLEFLYYTATSTPFPPDCLPNLKTLCACDWNEAFKVLIGRPTIRHLDLYGTFVRDTYTIVPSALGNITVLACKDLADFDAFETAVPHLSRLRVLGLVGLMYISRIRKKPEVIAGLKSLVVFVWSTTRSMSPRVWSAWGTESHSGAVNSWFQEMPDLKKVYIQIGDYTNNWRNYGYWGGDGVGPALVSSVEVVRGHGFHEFDLLR